MLNIAINNNQTAQLIEDIVLDHSLLDGLDSDVVRDVINYSAFNDDYRVLDILANSYTGIYDYDEKKPEWLESSFEDAQWVVKFKSKPRTIYWDSVYLDDGKNLTDKAHKKLLNAFKYWILAVGNPFENGGQLVKNATASGAFNRVILFINAILLNSKALKLAKYQLQNVDEDFWRNTLMKIAKNGINGVYEFDKRAEEFLNQVSDEISNDEVQQFQDSYPHILETVHKDDARLYLKHRQKACTWLSKQGFYKTSHRSYIFSGNTTKLIALLFEGKALYHGVLGLRSYPELHLKEAVQTTEYRAVENKDTSSGLSDGAISHHISSLSLIYTNLERKDAAQPPLATQKLNSRSIGLLVDIKKSGRTRTLPPKFVFNLIKQCFEFAMEHLPEGTHTVNLLDETLTQLSEGKDKSIVANSNRLRPIVGTKAFDEARHRNMASKERGYWFQAGGVNCLSSDYQEKGVKQIERFTLSDESRYGKIRNNESLFDLFSVLQGAIQILVGAIMARRQDELVNLKSHENLSPNIDPFSEKGSQSEYNLVFKVKKSGDSEKNATIERPIPLSIARLIWRLEQFNIKAMDLKLDHKKLSLFNVLDSQSCHLSPIAVDTFNGYLDAACDFFETDLVQYPDREHRRNYVRQHQFRRFFAMAFFWSKGFDGMDSLRWMLAHTDMEHLYRYISESETGEVLNGAKASVIVRGIVDPESDIADLDGIEELREIIAERLTGYASTPITILTLGEAAEDYDDESYSTVPTISQIQKEQDVESEVLTLLDEGLITLEPDFFTVKGVDGEEVKDFNLLLKIKDLD
ncbi:integrase [Vibrio cyclitrophicus]|uniref:integrase n=1 Tax=Vibrio cyclitrophicus TaxID=47951 RepID=UPI000C85811E|nr:integrase [Vibrio cyclitrophicus]PMJ53679.1 integrase [Vibrio cyclitrophicus]